MSSARPLLCLLRTTTTTTAAPIPLSAGTFTTRSYHALKKKAENKAPDASRRRQPKGPRGSPPSSSPSSSSRLPQSTRETPTPTLRRMSPRQSQKIQALRAKQAMHQRLVSFEAQREQDTSQWAEQLAEKRAKQASEEKHRQNVQELKRSMQADALRLKRKDLERRIANRAGSWRNEIHTREPDSERTDRVGGRWAEVGKVVPRAIGTNIQSWTKGAQVREERQVRPRGIISKKSPSISTTQLKKEAVRAPPPPKPKIAMDSKGLPQLKEFYQPPPSLTQRKGKLSAISFTNSLSSQSSEEHYSFKSPPLLSGLVSCLHDILGPDANPTQIQRLSIAKVVDPINSHSANPSSTLASSSDLDPPTYKEFLLASETGSGKSIAYLLPLLQSLKLSELSGLARKEKDSQPSTLSTNAYAYNPRSLILAPTHELARQLSGFAKTLSHEIKLRVVCTSKANSRNRDRDADRTPAKASTVSKEMQVTETAGEKLANGATELDVRPLSLPLSQVHPAASETSQNSVSVSTRPVDIMVGTPMKFLEMVFGRGWDRPAERNSGSGGSGRRIGRPEMGLANIEWVIVDEADVLFDPDFNSFTRLLLAEISKARGKEVGFVKEDKVLSAECYPEAPEVVGEDGKVVEAQDATSVSDSELSSSSSSHALTAEVKDSSPAPPTRYPFNLILTTATIPPALLFYLQQHHPAMFFRRHRRGSPRNAGVLRSSGLHRLPSSLKIEQVDWSGGNKLADIEKRLRAVWMEDERRWMGSMGKGQTELSKVIVFCNKSAKVDDLGVYLEEKGIKTVMLTSKISSVLSHASEEEDNNNAAAATEEEKEERSGTSERKGSERRRGSNKHLEGFLRVRSRTTDTDAVEETSSTSTSPAPRRLQPLVTNPSRASSSTSTTPTPTPTPTLSDTPHVLLTTSLLSRGLDFSPSVRHVFIVDEPRNVVDFLHRAGRTARAGTEGVVVVFGKGGRSTSRGKKGMPMEWRGGRR
ncbi:P-loop containing nucleoside triphosphate hydrolase protein [Lentinula raphanica]|nr:P-loop containing nucleoside triphosphate hydrolase protein [Lentinula raphanica]